MIPCKNKNLWSKFLLKKKKYIVLVVETLSCILNYNYFVVLVCYRIGEGKGKREGEWREGVWRGGGWREGEWREEKINQ